MATYHVVRASTPEDAPDELGVDPLCPFLEGAPYQGKPIHVMVRLSTLTRVLDIWWMGRYLLMSGRALDIVQKTGESHFELYRVTLVDRAGQRDEGFAQVVHLLNNVPCMDKQKSVFQTDEDDPEWIDVIKRLALIESQIPRDRHLFRMAEAPNVVLCSATLMDNLKSAQVRGVKFVPVGEYVSR